MTLFEAMLAVLLLSICLVPAAEALRGAIAAPGDVSQAARALDCVSARMETVLAEPYGRLLDAAGSIDAASVYSTAPAGTGASGTACPAIAVAIARYANDSTRQIGPGGNSAHLLYVSARLADSSAGNRFALTTLVAR